MSKELPYFKFYTSEWLNGDITLEDFELQGLFISVCAYYWHKECVVTYEQVSKKFRTNLLTDLSPEFFQVDEETNYLTIKFLDEQFVDFETRKNKLSNAGKKGAQIKAEKKKQATLKPPLSDPLAIREDKIIEDNSKEDNMLVKFSFKSELLKLGVNTVLITEWLKVRKTRRATNSKTAFEAILREIKKSQLEPKEVIRICVENSWSGFNAEWLKNKHNGTKINTGSNRAVTTTAERQNFE